MRIVWKIFVALSDFSHLPHVVWSTHWLVHFTNLRVGDVGGYAKGQPPVVLDLRGGPGIVVPSLGHLRLLRKIVLQPFTQRSAFPPQPSLPPLQTPTNFGIRFYTDDLKYALDQFAIIWASNNTMLSPSLHNADHRNCAWRNDDQMHDRYRLSCRVDIRSNLRIQ
ncbi:unnamed protein product [Mesocestoides corti]|uniref:Secreted protein n=1 Tax=Mesocestoides corti TaxID=53468 RepID=A0A0R3UCI7_MESCO|nr:unnamed protein product [Mesocestoides corti]